MDNQHRKIKGYRELNAEEIALMNEIKEMGKNLEALCSKVDFHITDQRNNDIDQNEEDRLDEAEPEKWAFEGKNELKKGLMFLTRAVAQPTTF